MVGGRHGENEVQTTQDFLEVERVVGLPLTGGWVHNGRQLRNKGSAKVTMWVNHNAHVPTWPTKRLGVEAQAQGGAGGAPWPFSCEVVVGRSSKPDEQTQEEGPQEEPDPRMVQVVVVPHQVARDRHTERDRASYGRDDIRTWLREPKRGHTSQGQTLRLVRTWHAK